jgi:SAM-dependent methyltransferase
MRTFESASDVCPDSDERRLRALEALCDSFTTTMLGRAGLAPDWRCLEIGAGRGSIARWLATQCSSGFVTATDTDTRHLTGLRIPNLLVCRHDVVDGPDLPAASFDLAHVRALLVHLPDRQTVLRRIRDWLVPGGWLVVEEPVLFPVVPRHESCLRHALAGFEQLMADQLGSDFRWASHLATAFRTAGFTEVNITTDAAEAANEFWRINLTELGPDLVESGYVDQNALTRALVALDHPDHVDLAMAFVCASGRRPYAQTFPTTSQEE